MSDHATVLFFATLRDRAGVRETRLEFPHGANISDIKKLLVEKYPNLNPSIDTVIVAMNHEYASDEILVPDGAEIAVFPPVSGGHLETEKYPTIVDLVDDEININRILEQVTLPTTGAACIFSGIVREMTYRGETRQTDHLEYEAYRNMAISKMRQISEEIRSQWGEVEGVAIVQRIGFLLPGMISVIIACTSSHRDSAIFTATRYGIDRLKEIVPIWKKEVSKEGEEWIEGDYFPHNGE